MLATTLVSRVDDLGVNVCWLRLNSGAEGGEEVGFAAGAAKSEFWVVKTTYASP